MKESNSQVPSIGLAQRCHRMTLAWGKMKGVMMLRKAIVSTVALVGLTGFASAADLAFKAPPPVYVPTWTGCYIGGHAGYGQTTSTSQYTYYQEEGFNYSQLNQSFDNKGFVGGGQAGCQLQTGMFLWGLEGDWSSFSNSASKNFAGGYSEPSDDGYNETVGVNQTVNYNSLWSVRGRFGGIFSDVYHLYVTAGIGGAKGTYAYSGHYQESYTGDPCYEGYCFSSGGNSGFSPTGIVFGAGAEWKIWSNFVVGAEYLHYALLSDTSLPLNNSGGYYSYVGPGYGDHVHTNNVDVLRVRASYLFNWWGGR
jgi:outer membrane immunogenic protein